MGLSGPVIGGGAEWDCLGQWLGVGLDGTVWGSCCGWGWIAWGSTMEVMVELMCYFAGSAH